MSNSMQVTEPVTQPATNHPGPYAQAPCVHPLSPLARAALANGVSFDDVRAYLNYPQSRALDVHLFEQALTDSPELCELFCSVDNQLDAALARSVLAEGTIEHARLWWRGVL